MKHLACVLILLASSGLTASDVDVAGTWNAVFTGAPTERPKVPSKIILDLKVEGNKLTGMAHMNPYPGDAPLSDGTINGGQVTFTVLGKLPFGVNGERVSGFPNLVFTGTIRGNEMELAVQWGSVLVNGEKRPGPTFHMQGKKAVPVEPQP
jgi:hypothetical protein